MEKNLDELNQLAIEKGFSGAHNAISCAEIYRTAYTEYLNKYETVEKILISINELLPIGMKEVIETKCAEAKLFIKTDLTDEPSHEEQN